MKNTEERKDVQYTYWIPVVNDEHFLTSTEIASAYKIRTTTGNPHNRLVLEILKGYSAENEYPVCHYPAAKGNMVPVFPQMVYQDSIEQAMQHLKRGNSISVNGKNYNYVLGDGHE